MDTDIISYEALLAAQDSTYWVMFGAIATAVTAIVSLLTLSIAVFALTTWKTEEKTKIKSEFKRSLLALDYAIHMMPDGWDVRVAQWTHKAIARRANGVDLNEGHIADLNNLKKCWHDALSAWVMCEGQLKKTELTRLWKELSDIYVKYYTGHTDKITILNKLSEMHSINFIFE